MAHDLGALHVEAVVEVPEPEEEVEGVEDVEVLVGPEVEVKAATTALRKTRPLLKESSLERTETLVAGIPSIGLG